MGKILLSVLLFGLSNICAATTIVIYITPDFVIMATDSKGVYTNVKTYQKDIKIVPKIYKRGNIYFSLAGLTSNSVKLLDIGQIADAGLKKATDFKAGIEVIKTTIRQALLIYLNNQKKNNYNLFRKNIEASNFITSLGFVGIQGNKPYAHLLGFKVIDGRELKITIEEEIYAHSNKDAVYYLGTSAAIEKHMNTVNRNNVAPETFVENLINLQIENTPLEVGPPIDIIKITPKATTWIRKKNSTPIELK